QYASNCIQTSKYNIVTFLPVNLFEQFQEVANTYFLFLLILQLIPQISSLSWFTTIVPLVLVLTITAVKDATDDYFRHKSDNQVNNRQSQVLINGTLRQEQWMNVRVGDIIKLENNHFVAADLLLLSSSEPHGLCYIETAELDGETNMKVRQAIPVTSELGDIGQLAQFDGEVICEPPNNKLDKFSGTLYWKENKYPLSNQNMLLRGCMLRNTEWCFGLVVFAGPDTKLMQNSGRTKFKRTSIDRLMNTLVLWVRVRDGAAGRRRPVRQPCPVSATAGWSPEPAAPPMHWAGLGWLPSGWKGQGCPLVVPRCQDTTFLEAFKPGMA
uniref:P-type ATPase N-terminal domain-containing protein n=1 Tax=Chelydra serpentina TaxID=8475 RepID=A0A8C3SAJ8_CHESE